MNSINEFEPNLHACIITMTGGGKTTLGAKIFENLDHRAIFVDFQSEKVLDKFTWVRSTKLLGQAMRESKKVVLRTRNVQEIETMVEWVFNQKRKFPEFANTETFLFFDEIQKYSHIKIIDDVFNMGRKWKVHGVFMVRQIQEMKNLGIISQCDEMIFLKLNDIGQRTLKNNYGIKIPPEVLRKINSGKRDEKDKLISDFNSVLYDKFTWMLFDKNGDFVGEFNQLDGEIENVESIKPENKEITDSGPAPEKPEESDQKTD